MNHYSYDIMQKEKIRDRQKVGMTSQSFHRSGASAPGLLRGLPKLVLLLLGLLGMLGLLVR